MKIIKKGTKTLPEEVVYVTRCKVCGCKFTYTIKNITFSIFPEELSGKLRCPQCKYLKAVPLIKRKYKGSE